MRLLWQCQIGDTSSVKISGGMYGQLRKVLMMEWAPIISSVSCVGFPDRMNRSLNEW